MYRNKLAQVTGPYPYSKEYCPDEIKDVEYLGGGRQSLWWEASQLAPTSTWAEFGVGNGNSAFGLGRLLPEDGELFLFDSWQGIPEEWVLGDTLTEPAGQWKFDRLEVSDPRLVIVDGLFAKTLPYPFIEQLGLIHIDCDLYSSTRDVLFGCDDAIEDGTVIIFDEYWGYQNYAEHEYKACSEWTKATGKRIDWIGRTQFEAAGVVRG